MKARGRRQRLPVVLTEEEEVRLVAAVNPKSMTGLRNRAMLAAMLGAGLRVSEVVKLMPSALDMTKGTLTVVGSKSYDRTVPFDQHTCGWLRSWAEKRVRVGLNGKHRFFPALRGSQAFGGEFGKAMSVGNVQVMIGRLAEKAEIVKHVTPHTLRHTYATRSLAKAGYTLRHVQKLLGHSSVATTEIYTHVSEEELRQVVQGEDPEPTPEQELTLEQQVAALTEQVAALTDAGGGQ